MALVLIDVQQLLLKDLVGQYGFYLPDTIPVQVRLPRLFRPRHHVDVWMTALVVERRVPAKILRRNVEKFLECVLDVDSAGREPQKQAAKNYHYDQPRNPELFRFEPIPLSFEPVEPGRCAPVLYSSAVRDMCYISFSASSSIFCMSLSLYSIDRIRSTAV